MVRSNKEGEGMQAPAVVTEKKSLTIDDILAAEVQACKKAMPLPPAAPKTRMRIPLEDFVRRSFMLHRHLFEAWSGWRFRGEPFLMDDPALAEQVADQEWTAFLRQVGNLYRDEQITDKEASRPSCVINSGYNYVQPKQLLAQKNMASTYFTHVDGINGQQHVTFDKDKEWIIDLGNTNGGANQYGRYGREMYAKIKVGQRISSAIMRALEENGASKPLTQTWEKLFQRLGELAWGSQKTPIQTTLSCAPSSFIRLGTLGENSCYRHGGEGEYSKYWLAADCPNSFVAMFHRILTPTVKVAEEKDPSLGLSEFNASNLGPAFPPAAPRQTPTVNVCARAWGIAQMGKGALVSNFYQLPREMLMPSLVETLSKALHAEGLVSAPAKVDAVSGTEWRAKMHAQGSVYLNSDVQLVRPADAEAELISYLRQVLDHSGTFGFYTRKGFGPQLMQVNENIVKVVHTPEAVMPKAWPYEDVNLLNILQDAMARGLFIGGSGIPNVIPEPQVAPVPHPVGNFAQWLQNHPGFHIGIAQDPF